MAEEPNDYSATDEGTDSCEKTLFVEKDEVMELLHRLVSSSSTSHATAEESNNLVSQVQKILEKYQEQSYLLDSHLEAMMKVIMDRAVAITEEKEAISTAQVAGAFPFQVCRDVQFHSLMAVSYQLCRVRGYKMVMKFMPHEVANLEPVLHMLQSQDRCDFEKWTSRYTLLLWLAMLCMVPFDIATIDSTFSGSINGEGGSLIDTILSICKDYLSDAAVTREAAAVCLGNLLARPDMEGVYMDKFVQYATDILNDRAASSDDGLTATTFIVSGVMSALASLYKKGHRDKLLAAAPHILPPLTGIAHKALNQSLLRKMVVKLFQRIGLAYLPPRVVAWRYERGQRSLLHNLTLNGNAAVEAQREQQGVDEDVEDDNIDVPEALEDVLEQLLCGLRDKDTVVRWSAAKGIGRITGRLPKALADDVVGSVLDLFSDAEGDGGWHGGCLALAELARRGLLLPARLPAAVPVVVKALQYDVRRGQAGVGAHVRDAACYVCWAFARAYSPAILSPYIPELCGGMLVIALFDREINVRRAAAAAFQENVGRQGNANVPHGIEVLTAADYFSLGSRSNAYLTVAPFVSKFDAYRNPIIDHLVEVKLQHWDENVRGLAAQSLATLVPLDANRFIDTVLPSSISGVISLDRLRRHGSLLAVGEIVLALSKCSITLSPDLVEKVGGAIPALEAGRFYRGRGGESTRAAACHLIECVAKAKIALNVKSTLRLLDTADECLKNPAEYVQTAAAKAVRQLLSSYFPVGVDGPSERLKERTVGRYVSALESGAAGVASTTRGLALAIGALPRRIAACDRETLQRLLRCLVQTSHPEAKVGGEPDAETRRNAINALGDVCCEVGCGSDCNEGGVRMGLEEVNMVFTALLGAMEDYGMDKRGDVGSWCRVAAMLALERIVLVAVSASKGVPTERGTEEQERVILPSLEERKKLLHIDVSDSSKPRVGGWDGVYITPPMCHSLIAALLKQMSEKLDGVRDQAGNVLHRLLCSSAPALPFIPCAPQLKSLLVNRAGAVESSTSTSAKNWASPTTTFPLVVQTLSLPPYHEAVCEGLVISVGGLTESVVKASSSALLQWTRTVGKRPGNALSLLAVTLTSLLKRKATDDRVALPLLRTLDLLLTNDVFSPLGSDSLFNSEALAATRLSLKGSRSVPKLQAGASVLLGLMGVKGRTAAGALKSVVILLGHRFPRVRKYVAELLYVRLLAWEDSSASEEKTNTSKSSENIDDTEEQILITPESVDNALDILMRVAWDGDQDLARGARQELAVVLGVKLEVSKVSNSSTSRTQVDKDSLESYEALVRDVGY